MSIDLVGVSSEVEVEESSGEVVLVGPVEDRGVGIEPAALFEQVIEEGVG